MRRFLAGVMLLVAVSARAQWMTQTIPLVAGWNAVHLKVQPPDDACADVFAGKPVTVVSWWCRDTSDLGDGSPAGPDLRVWHPGNPAASTFHRMLGGESYLIQTTAPTTLTVTGVPALPNPTLLLGMANLVGMSLPYDIVYMLEYFQFLPMYTLNAYAAVQANGTTLTRYGTYTPKVNEAVWVTPVGEGTVEYAGPFNITLDSPAAVIAFGGVLTPRTLRIKNNASVARTVRIDRIASEAPPAGQGTLAGDVPLMRSVVDWSAGYPRETYADMAFPWVTNIAAGATLELKLLPKVASMPACSGAYQSILTVSDQGSADNHSMLYLGRCRYFMGVRAEGDLAEQTQPTGLWVGDVVLVGVNRAQMFSNVSNAWDHTALQDAPHPFGFRVILHVDEYGQTRLMKEAFVASVPQGQPNEGNTLLASRGAVESFQAQNPAAAIRRLSSANFPFMPPLNLAGDGFAIADAMLVGIFELSHTNRVNPFVHAFHPDHDSVGFSNGERFEKEGGTGDYESWTVTRKVTFTFAANDPAGANPAWNVSVTGGTYEEQVTGLGKTDILAAGAFRLAKVADVPRILYVSGP